MKTINIFTKFIRRFATPKIGIFFGRSEDACNSTLRDNETVGAIADVIATNVAKLSPQVIRKDASGITVKNDRLSRLLCIRPCPEMSTYDFLYRLASDAIYNSNAFAVILYNKDFTEIERIQPISVDDHKIFEDDNGNLFFEFVWSYDQKRYTVPYSFVIHIKSRYNQKRFFGTSPDSELRSSLELLETTYSGIKNVIKNSASLRGYLKYTNIADEEELQNKVNEFKKAYLSAENEGGIAGLDSTYDFHEITQKPASIPAEQVSFLRQNFYNYYHVNEKILTSSFNEQEWNSFYESAIEPFAIQLCLEFTFKLFSEKQRGFGNKVIFTSNRLQYATLRERSQIAKDMFDRGAITINQYLELMYYPPIEGGDIRMVSLNYVKVDDQTKYQVGTGTSSSENSVSEQIKMLLEGGEKSEQNKR